MFVSPQQFIFWNLLPDVMTLGCVAFGRLLDPKDGVSMNGISALI